jgi:hypothetical protein
MRGIDGSEVVGESVPRVMIGGAEGIVTFGMLYGTIAKGIGGVGGRGVIVVDARHSITQRIMTAGMRWSTLISYQNK